MYATLKLKILKRYIDMNSQLTAFITLSCTSGTLNLYLCLYVFLQRFNYTKIAHLFISYTVLISTYCFAFAFGLIADNIGSNKDLDRYPIRWYGHFNTSRIIVYHAIFGLSTDKEKGNCTTFHPLYHCICVIENKKS